MGVFRRFLITLSYVTSLPIKLDPLNPQPDSVRNEYDANGTANDFATNAQTDFARTESDADFTAHDAAAAAQTDFTRSESDANATANDSPTTAQTDFARTENHDNARANDSAANDQTSELAGLAKYLPAAGLLIGAILVGIAALLLYKLHAPYLVTGPLLAIAWLCLTGGLHFDGLMDAADGVFSHRNRERMLEIMMDSRVGNFGAITGMAVLILKCATLASLVAHPLLLLGTLAIVPAWARWCELYAIGRFPYAREVGKGKIWHDSTRFPDDLVAGMMLPVVVTAIVAIFVGLPTILPVVAFVLASGLTASHWLASHIKGHTGDTYGAVVELAETGCLILVSTIIM